MGFTRSDVTSTNARAVLTWFRRRLWFWAWLDVAVVVSAAGIVLSQPWEFQDPSFRAGILQTFATWGALTLAIPAAWAAWEAYRLALVRVPLRLILGETRGPAFGEPVRVLLENRGEVDARPFVLELTFNVAIRADDVMTVWPGLRPVFLYDPDEPLVHGVTYVFSEPLHHSGPEVLVDLTLPDAIVIVGRGPDEFAIRWNVRGGNVLQRQETLIWSPP